MSISFYTCNTSLLSIKKCDSGVSTEVKRKFKKLYCVKVANSRYVNKEMSVTARVASLMAFSLLNDNYVCIYEYVYS